MSDKFLSTYVWPFKIAPRENVHETLTKFGWSKKNHIFDQESEYNIRSYFPATITDLFFNNAGHYTRNDFLRIAICSCANAEAEFSDVKLLLMPNNICLLIFSVDFKNTRLSIPGPADADQFLYMHSLLRQLYPPYYSKGEAGGIGELSFYLEDETVIKYDPAKLPKLERGIQPLQLSPWLTLLNPKHEYDSTISHPLGIIHLTDNRLPNMFYIARTKEELDNKPFIYRSLVGDAPLNDLPRASSYTSFLRKCEINDYYDKNTHNLNTRYFVYSHCFAITGSNTDSYFASVVLNTYRTSYLLMFLLSWYQYLYLQSNLAELRGVDHRGRAAATAATINKLMEATAKDLTPTVLSEGVFQLQATPFKEKLSASLSIESLAINLKTEIDELHNYTSSREATFLSSAAMYIGLLSIISIVVSLFLGLIGSDSSNVQENIQKFLSTFSIIKNIELSTVLFMMGLCMVLVISFGNSERGYKGRYLTRNLFVYCLSFASIAAALAMLLLIVR